MAAIRLALHLAHVWAWGLYCGSLIYIYARLMPDVRRWLASDDRFEAFSLTTGHGLRWWIFGALVTAGATGAALVLVRPLPDPGPVWWALIAAKAVLLLATLALYAYVSYVMWPRRVFVALADRPAEQRRFVRTACALMALLVGQLLLGAAAYVRW